MANKRYWALFLLAAGLGIHALVVGQMLASMFFVMIFFWGWVAVCALRGELELAQAMVITMCILLFATVTMIIAYPHYFEHELAYYSLALYPAMVSWTSVYFYIRHLRTKAGAEEFSGGARRRRRMEAPAEPEYVTYGKASLTAP